MATQNKASLVLGKVRESGKVFDNEEEILESRFEAEFKGKNGFKLRVQTTVVSALVALIDDSDRMLGHVMLNHEQRKDLAELLNV